MKFSIKQLSIFVGLLGLLFGYLKACYWFAPCFIHFHDLNDSGERILGAVAAAMIVPTVPGFCLLIVGGIWAAAMFLGGKRKVEPSGTDNGRDQLLRDCRSVLTATAVCSYGARNWDSWHKDRMAIVERIDRELRT